jgi:hypothetical protein
MSYAPYEFKEHNFIMPKDMKDCYFLVEFYFLVGFLEKKLPLEIVQFIFAIVKEKQKILRALHVANRALHVANRALREANWAYQKTIHSVLDEYQYHRSENLCPWGDLWRPMGMNGRLECLKYSDEVNLADEVNQTKKNKKLWVKKKKEKLSNSKNRGLKR